MNQKKEIMTKNQIEAVAALLEAMQAYFDCEEKEQHPQERTPIRTMSPKIFSAMCTRLKVSNETAYLLASFALALAKGMAENPGDIPAMCGGTESPRGGELIVALEALRVSMSNNHKTD